MSLTKFQETLVALTATRNHLERAMLCFYSASGARLSAKPDRIKDPYLCFTLQNYLQILLCSFTEEWSTFGGFAKTDERVKETLRIVYPATNRFAKWRGLEKIRSGLLAHSPRDKNGKLVFPWDAFREQRCPNTLEETLLLTFCAIMAIDIVRERHKMEQEKADGELLAMNRSIMTQGISDTAALERDFAEIQNRISENKMRAARG